MPSRPYLALLLLTALWWIAVAFVGLSGDFPISDDWAYAETVRLLLETGEIQRPRWVWSPSLTHVAWGALFAGVLDFNYESLRLSSAVAGWILVCATFGLARQVGVSVGLAFMAAATVAMNPLIAHLSLTFMTDIGFAALCAGALWAGARFLQRPAIWPALIVLAVTILAALSRQAGIMIVIAIVACFFLQHRFDRRVWWIAGGALLAALALNSLAPIIYGSGDSGGHMQIGWFIQNQIFSRHSPYHFSAALATALPVLGLSLAPLLPWVRPSRWALGAGLFTAVCVVAVALRLGFEAPFHLDILRPDLGVGVLTLARPPVDESANRAIWWILDSLGAAVTGALLFTAWERRTTLHGRPETWALVLFPVFCMAVLTFQNPFFDRWMAPFLASCTVFTVVLARSEGPASSDEKPPTSTFRDPTFLASAALLALVGLWGWGGTASTLTNHRARWALLHELEAKGFRSEQIHGGLEYNGLRHWQKGESQAYIDASGTWWVIDDEILITLSPAVEGYEPIREPKEAGSWLGRDLTLFVQRRIDGAEPLATPEDSSAPTEPAGDAAFDSHRPQS